MAALFTIFALALAAMCIYNFIVLKRRRELLKETQLNLEMATKSSSISIWVYSCDESEFRRLYGDVPLPDKLSLDGMYEYMSEYSRNLLHDTIERFISCEINQQTILLKGRRVLSEGPLYLETQIISSFQNTNSSPKQLVFTFKDITEQYLDKKELEEQQKRFDFALKVSNLVQWEYDNTNHRFHSSNERIKGNNIELSAEDYKNAIHPDDWENTKAIIDLMNEGRDEQFVFNKRLRYHPEDYWHYTTVTGAPVEYDDSGKVIRYTGFRSDDTEWKNIKDNLEKEKLKAQESDMLKSAFLANMSHEIRTPLNAIVGFSSLIANGDMNAGDADIKEYTRLIESNSNQLLVLISDILDLSRIESNSMEFKFINYHLNNLFTNICSVQQLTMKPGIKLICDIPDNDTEIRTDVTRLNQVINNLINNARKFTQSGNITFGYRISDDGKMVNIFVRDTGCGMNAESLRHIFERFYKGNKFAQGTGLGLAICKTIVDKFGGTIDVKSEIGKCTEFSVNIPIT